VAGRYQKARPYSVEALLLYGVCKYMREEVPDKDAWMIMGISARLAMNMGYHRDPRHLANISPFEGEMRRRTFFIVEIFDLLFSFQAGLPAIIHEE
jgi:Fungal specific transcription factor domain